MARRTQKKRKRRVRKSWFSQLTLGTKIMICIAATLVCFIGVGATYIVSQLSKVKTETIDNGDIVINTEVRDIDLGEGYTNVAIFGGDSRTGELAEGVRSDCIIVASLNNVTKEVKMVSVYRDTLLDIKSGDYQKCNAAYSYGGPTQAINMLNKNLDLDIQDYVTVDFGAVAEVVDLLGGIEIDLLEEEVKETNKFIAETAMVAGKEGNYIENAGLQVLDGVQATTYARIRKNTGGDFKRAERQRIVIEKIAEKLKRSNLATVNKIVNAVFPSVSTSFSLTDILYYAKSFTKYVIGETTGFPIDKATDTVQGKGSIVIPVTLESNVRKLHDFLFAETDYVPSTTVEEISNSIINEVGRRKPEVYEEEMNGNTSNTN